MDTTAEGERQDAYHLFLDADEIPLAQRAVRLFLADEAHQARIRQLAREVLVVLEADPQPDGKLTVPLTPEQMKIAHSAVGLLLDDLRREQAAEREILRRILGKLPDEHTMRAITIE